MWSRREPKENAGQQEQWVEVARVYPILNAADADIAVARLHDAGIPAMRLPTTMLTHPGAGKIGSVPVRVLVPPERAQEARELLEEEV